MPQLVRVGRQWFGQTGEDWIDLVYTGGRITQLRPEALPGPLHRFLKAHQFEWSPEHSAENPDVPSDLREAWSEFEQRYGALAKTLDEANQGFCRGDDPSIDVPVLLDNRALYTLYGLAREEDPCYETGG
jgi:hypothetical protein